MPNKKMWRLLGGALGLAAMAGCRGPEACSSCSTSPYRGGSYAAPNAVYTEPANAPYATPPAYANPAPQAPYSAGSGSR